MNTIIALIVLTLTGMGLYDIGSRVWSGEGFEVADLTFMMIMVAVYANLNGKRKNNDGKDIDK